MHASQRPDQLLWLDVVGAGGVGVPLFWPRHRPEKGDWVMGPSFCLRPRTLLNLLKALLARHNKSDRPLGAFPFQFHLQKPREVELKLEIPKSFVQAPYLQGNHPSL